MSRFCDKCGRGPKSSVSRSHSNIATKQKKFPNLQVRKMNGKKLLICAKCLKTMVKA